MKNLLTVILCIVSFAAFSQSFNNTFPHSGFGDQVELEETGYRVMGFGNNITGNHLLVIHVDEYGDTRQVRKIYFDFDFFNPTFTLRSASDRDGNQYVNFPYSADSISIVKLSPDWEEVWRKSLTNKQGQIAALSVTDDNHVIAAASQKLFKLDGDGNVLWQQYYGETDVIETRANSIVETGTGDLFLYSIDYWAEPDQFYWEMPTRPKLRIFSQNGEMRDSTLLPGYTGSSISYGSDYICLGSEREAPRRTLLYRHDINGLIFQEREIHLGENVRLYSMVENHEGNLVALGYLDYNIVLHCMTKEGDSLWTRYIINEAKAVPMNMKLAADGGYVISYFFEANDGTSNPGLIKTDALGNISSLGFEESDINQRVKVYPNPAADYVVFEMEKPMHSATITVTDITGRQVATIPLTDEKTTWQTGGLPSGVYLYRIEDAATIASGRLVILNE